MDIRVLISRSADQRAELARALDEVGHAVRLRAVRDLGRAELAALFEVASENEPATLNDLVPPELSPLTEVIHHGKNSLPAFSHFQKRFCRADAPDGAGAEELWGYNEQSMRLFTGPGYFVAYQAPDEAAASGGPGVVIDYRKVPPKRPAGWPPVHDNRSGIGRFVYGESDDLVRKVSAYVTVGRMRKGGAFVDAWFALVRQPSTSAA